MTTEPTGTTNEGSADPGMFEAIERVMVYMGCSREDDNGTHYCLTHMRGWLWDVDACVRAEGIATAAREDVPDLTRRLVEAEAKVARVEAALRLIGDEHITPVGARQIRAALADPAPVEQHDAEAPLQRIVDDLRAHGWKGAGR